MSFVCSSPVRAARHGDFLPLLVQPSHPSAQRGRPPQQPSSLLAFVLLLWLSAPSSASATASASAPAAHGQRSLLSASTDMPSVFNSSASVFSFTDFAGAATTAYVYQLGPWPGLAGYRFVQNGGGAERRVLSRPLSPRPPHPAATTPLPLLRRAAPIPPPSLPPSLRSPFPWFHLGHWHA